jgi:hypothetical protein
MGVFDNLKNDNDSSAALERIEKLGINAENLSVEVEDGVTYITGSVESEEDLAAIEEEFFGDTMGAVTTNIDVDVIQYYEIQDGDSPWSVADAFWGDGNKYPILVEMNDGKDKFYTGDVIMVPSLRSYVGGMKLQVILSALGYEVGAIDGVIGSRTTAAIKEFQRDNDMDVTGKLDDETRSALRYSFRENVEELSGIELQFVLDEVGYDVGAIDGVIGSKTKTAIKEFQNDNELDVTGEADEDTVATLAAYFV